MENNKNTVAEYLKTRLEQLGLRQMFGVAGNYTAAFLDTILADEQSPIKISGNANELCAGYAADAYARVGGKDGIGALYVTYSVGAFSLLNCLAGSFTEMVPVLLINGAPTNKEDDISKNAGLLYSHTTGYQQVDIHMFRPITAAAERITNAAQAPYQIDSALMAMITQRSPAYLEVAEDVWRANCVVCPDQKLEPGIAASVFTSEAWEAAEATWALIKQRPKTLFWAGIELQRLGLEDQFLDLLETINEHPARKGEQIKFVTTALSKSVISEEHPYFETCATLNQENVLKLVEKDGLLIGLGAWTTGKDTGSQNIRSEGTVLASHGGVLVGAKYYPMVSLTAYMEALKKAFVKEADEQLEKMTALRFQQPEMLAARAMDEPVFGYDEFFKTLQGLLTEEHVLVVDAGYPLIGAQGLKIKEAGGFVAQAAWLSIGYSVGAATGIKCARPDKRVLNIVGDGAFHETCQAVSDHTAYGHNTVVFVMSNGIYGIEQYLVNPNPYRKDNKVDYTGKEGSLLNDFYPYNKLPRWDFVKLAEGFGAVGKKVTNKQELMEVWEEIEKAPDQNFVVEVVIPADASPEAITKKAAEAVGEDEVCNPNWPPKELF